MNDSNVLNEEKLLSMLEETQDQVEDLQAKLEAEEEKNSAEYEQILTLSSENSQLRKAIQEKSAMIVSLNEKIGSLAESDLVLKENEELKMQNDSIKASLQRVKQSARDEVFAAEKRTQDAMAALADRERVVSKRKADSCCTVMWISILYGVVATLLTAWHNKILLSDARNLLAAVWTGAKALWEWILTAGTLVAGLSDRISQPTVAVIVHWILLIAVIAVLMAIGVMVLGVPFIRYICFFRDDQADEISAIVCLMILAVGVFAGEVIRGFISINLIALMIGAYFAYALIRELTGMILKKT